MRLWYTRISQTNFGVPWAMAGRMTIAVTKTA